MENFAFFLLNFLLIKMRSHKIKEKKKIKKKEEKDFSSFFLQISKDCIELCNIKRKKKY
jgi:hypothetical protein